MVDEQTPTPTVIQQSSPLESPSPLAIISLVTGILGIVMVCCCYFLTPPLSITALILGYIERNNIKSGKSSAKGQGLATAGWILGIIGISLFVVALIIVIVLNILGIASELPSARRFQ